MRQRTFDDLGLPLADVTFCVLDLETTGGSPQDCAITEIGAVKVRGGVCDGTFQTLVNPGRAIPPEITVLTGITSSMVTRAPRIEAVLPTFLEFLGDAVVEGHNVRFDLSFLAAALERDQRPRLANAVVDTCALARRLLRDDVPNCKLDTLATRLRLDHRPSHRALDDALATTDLLHLLLERVGTLGVTGLDDLLALPTLAGSAHLDKLRLADGLPRSPGVYAFRDRRGEVLYVGKATNLRSRVRSYFSTDTRRKVGSLLRETARIDHRVCAGPLEASVLEVRLIQRHQPRYNRQGTSVRSYVYVTLTRDRFPRLTIARTPPKPGELHLGPLPSTSAARLVVEAIESSVPLRRCSGRVPATPREAPCTAAQLGVASCPCSGGIDDTRNRALVDRVRTGLTADPSVLLEPLARRMQALAAADRFEEAADVRDRAAALAGALRRQRRLHALRLAGTVRLQLGREGGVELDGGRLVRAWSGAAEPPPMLDLRDADADAHADTGASHEQPALGGTGAPPVPRELVDELACVAGWLDAHAHRVRVLHCGGGLAEPLPSLPSFAARRTTVRR
jgi:DNA polymerase-3 subunit epsilon